MHALYTGSTCVIFLIWWSLHFLPYVGTQWTHMEARMVHRAQKIHLLNKAQIYFKDILRNGHLGNMTKVWGKEPEVNYIISTSPT